jgi:hypothetical protein
MVTPGGRTPPAYLASQEMLKFLKIQQVDAHACGAQRSPVYQDPVNFGGIRPVPRHDDVDRLVCGIRPGG